MIELPEPEAPKNRTKRRGGRKFLFDPNQIKDLPVETIEIYPEGDRSHLRQIGFVEHRVLDYCPARLKIMRYVRYQYVDPAHADRGG